MLISVQGGFLLKDVRAVLLLPVYAALMHFGYGVGYLFAILKGCGSSQPTEHQAAAIPPPHAGGQSTCQVRSQREAESTL